MTSEIRNMLFLIIFCLVVSVSAFIIIPRMLGGEETDPVAEAELAISENRIEFSGIVIDKYIDKHLFSESNRIILESSDSVRKEFSVSNNQYINADINDTITVYDGYSNKFLTKDAELFWKVTRAST